MKPLRAAFRNRLNYLLALTSEVLAPLIRLSGRFAAGRARPREAWKKGVLLGADHIGDVLYRTASLPELARAVPGCEWSWFCGPPADEIVAADPVLAGRCVSLPVSVTGMPFFDLSLLLSEGRYDVALCYDTGQYWKLLLAATLAGIPSRVGYVHKGFSGLVTHPVAIRWPQPFAAYFRDLVAQLEGRSWGEGGQEARPRIAISADDEAAALRLWTERGLEGEKPVLACAFFSRQPKIHPMSQYAEVLRRMGGAARLLFLGAASERAGWERFLREEKLEGEIVAGELGLCATASLLRRCRILFASDSGLRHIAGAVGLPVVFGSNPGSHPVETGVYLPGETDVALADGSGIDIAKAESALAAAIGRAQKI